MLQKDTLHSEAHLRNGDDVLCAGKPPGHPHTHSTLVRHPEQMKYSMQGRVTPTSRSQDEKAMDNMVAFTSQMSCVVR